MTQANRPKWLIALEAANDKANLLAALANAEAPAVQGLLRQHHLVDPELPLQRVQAIKDALASGGLNVKDLFVWRDHVLAVESAVEAIRDFRQAHPLIDEFRSEHDLPRGIDDVVLVTIREALWRGDFPLREWVEFLDKRRDETDRHLFLFRLPEGVVQIPKVTTHFIWKAEKPELVNVVSDPGGRTFTLQWVGWRAGAKRPGQRSLTFLRLDLARRRIELQLQRMRSGGMQALLDERNSYVREVAALLQIQPEPLHLEPAIRFLLRNNRLKLKKWMIRTPNGGHLAFSGEPGFFGKLKLTFMRFYALELKGEWRAPPAADATVWMNARTDAIDIRSQCEPMVLNDLISTVYEQVEVAPRAAAPDVWESSVTQEEDDLRALLKKLVEYHRSLGEDVDISHPRRETKDDLLFKQEKLEEALIRFGVHYLGVTFYILCPRKGIPVHQDGQIVVFDRFDKIPEEVTCENEAETAQHPTKGNIWMKVGASPDGNGPPVRLAWILFAIYFPLLTLFFVWLSFTYPGPKQLAFIIVGYALSALAPVTAISFIYGKRAFDDAVKLIRDILNALLSVLPSGSRDKQQTTSTDGEDEDSLDDDDLKE